MKKLLASAAIAAFIVGGALTGAPPAQAKLSGCSHARIGELIGWRGGCTGGTGQARAWVNCHNTIWPFDAKMKYGAWVPAGRVSNAYCGNTPVTLYKTQTGGVETR